MRSILCVAVVSLMLLAHPAITEARSCLEPIPSSIAFQGANLVFTGTVVRLDVPKPLTRVNADGSMTVGLATEPTVATIAVNHVYRGTPSKEVTIADEHTDCDIPFKEGERWLIYAGIRNGRVTTGKCTRTQLVADAEAAQDFVYLDGLEQHRQQGIAYGYVLRRGVDQNGQPALKTPLEPLQVIAVGGGRRTEMTADKSGSFQLVLPPGDYEVWVERAGRAVMSKQNVNVEAGGDRRTMLPVEYKD